MLMIQVMEGLMSLRWLWSILMVLLVSSIGVVMMVGVGEIEQRAWNDSERQQSRLLTTLLAGELKMPMLANSREEVDMLVNVFRDQLPGSVVYLKWASGEEEYFGDQALPVVLRQGENWPVLPTSTEGYGKWHAMQVRYNTSSLGQLALYNPGVMWQSSAEKIRWRMAIILLIAAIVTGLLVFVFSGRVRRYLRLLARGCKAVGGGDFAIHLPIQSGNEFGKAFYQFNQMVSRLEQREKMYDLYGHYQRPELVAEEYDRRGRAADAVQEVSVLAVHLQVAATATVAVGIVQEEPLTPVNRYLNMLQFVAQSFDGHVERCSADGLVVVFNHPFEVKCHQNQAVKAGMAIAALAERLSTDPMGSLFSRCRIGFSVGELTIGYLGSGRNRQLTVVGEAMTTAMQLARSAPCDGVVAPYGSMLLLGHGFRPRELKDITDSDGESIRCIQILSGEAYIEQEVNDAVDKAMQRFNPTNSMDEEEQW